MKLNTSLVEGAIVGYIILESDDTLRLSAEVNQRIAKGWKPLGGIGCYYNARKETVHYVQAMVHEQAGQATPDGSPDPVHQPQPTTRPGYQP